MKKEQYTVIDLFAGCGGLSLGLYQAGWNGIFAVEKNPHSGYSYYWLPAGPMVSDDDVRYIVESIKEAIV